MEFHKRIHGARYPADYVPKAKAVVSFGLEALILAQSDSKLNDQVGKGCGGRKE
jgi:hypothetical protein